MIDGETTLQKEEGRRRNKDKLAQQLRHYTLRLLNGKKVREKKEGHRQRAAVGDEKSGKDIREEAS